MGCRRSCHGSSGKCRCHQGGMQINVSGAGSKPYNGIYSAHCDKVAGQTRPGDSGDVLFTKLDDPEAILHYNAASDGSWPTGWYVQPSIMDMNGVYYVEEEYAQ